MSDFLLNNYKWILALTVLLPLSLFYLIRYKREGFDSKTGNPYIEGGIKNEKIRLIVLLIGTFCLLASLFAKILEFLKIIK